tara:strand:- start:7 stop:804 length:798 start_codon:yes stop_codon:yes gene_type:complete
MKRIFALAFLISICLQSSMLANDNCKKDIKSSLNYRLMTDGTLKLNLKVSNESSNKIILTYLKYFYIDNTSTKRLTLNENLGPSADFEKDFSLKVDNKKFKTKDRGYKLYCEYGVYNKAAERKKLQMQIAAVIFVILLISFGIYANKKSRNKELSEYNKTHKNKIKTYAELEKIREEEENRKLHKKWDKEKKEKLREEAEIKKRVKEEEKKRLQEEKRLLREERKIEKEASGSDLISRLKRLKRMYNDGNLNKAEFEKAKNKLLK